MKIALLTPFYPYRGGIAQFSDRFYTELIKEYEVKVFSYAKLYPDFLFPGKTQYVPDPIDNPNFPSEQLLNSTGFSSFKKTAQAINDYNPDVLLVAYWMPYVAFALGRVCARLNSNIKIVGLVHNAIPHERSWLNKPLAMSFLKRCDGFVCMSENVRKDLLAMGTIAPILALEHPIYDHYPAKIDKEKARQKLGIDKDKKTVLFFGLIRQYKGLDLLIEAAGLLDSSHQFIIAGECYGSFSSYQQLIGLSANKDNIKVWNQYIPDEQVTDFFSAADVLILPYRSATQSGVIAIAYQMEIPIIATNAGSLGTVVEGKGIGIVAKEISAKSIAESIVDFFEEDKTSVFLENLEKEKVRLSWNNFTKKVVPFISDLPKRI